MLLLLQILVLLALLVGYVPKPLAVRTIVRRQRLQQNRAARRRGENQSINTRAERVLHLITADFTR